MGRKDPAFPLKVAPAQPCSALQHAYKDECEDRKQCTKQGSPASVQEGPVRPAQKNTQQTVQRRQRNEQNEQSSGWTCKSGVDRRAMTAVGGDRVLRF